MAQPRPAIPPRSNNDKSSHEDHGRASNDFDEHFLLTPPVAENGAGNPFDTTLQPPLHLSRLRDHNSHAYRQNARLATGKSGSPPGVEAATLYRDLQLKTDLAEMRRTSSVGSMDSDPRLRSSISAGSLPLRIPNVRARLHSTAGSMSPGSVISSPLIAAMLDITPLPSPVMGSDEWRALARSRSRASSTSSRHELPPPMTQTSPQRKAYAGLGLGLQTSRKSSLSEEHVAPDDTSRNQNRSVSEYVSNMASVAKPRNITVSTGHPSNTEDHKSPLHREDFLSIQRGIVAKEDSFPPKSNPFSTYSSPFQTDEPLPKRPKKELVTAQSIHTGMTKTYEMIRFLGQGTFSKVHLAIRIVHDRKDSVDYKLPSRDMAGLRARSRRLVAIKIVEPGPAGGADADRIEISLKREVELMKSIQHPSIIHLKSFGTEANGRALLVMNYCPGGDLFELASTQLNVLTPSLVRRIFSELVSAVRYLHQKYIVHRDIKLENVLLNIPIEVHNDVPNWQVLDRAVITLTDLGLSRSIPPPPESPLLETRCGSEDYAAPEILMGQPYDGRQTDAWALGVLLYALMEGRLPFDPVPGARGDPATLRARTPHRIARCEWQWVKYGDEDGDWDPAKGQELEGAMQCVDALLKRNTRRKPLADIREWPWVRGGIQIDGGLRWVEEEGM